MFPGSLHARDVGLARASDTAICQSARLTALGSDLRASSGRGAVERKDPFSKAKIEPAAHGSLHCIPPLADRQDRDAVEQFRSAHGRQALVLRIALSCPDR